MRHGLKQHYLRHRQVKALNLRTKLIMKYKNSPTKNRGFTLLEVLFALVISIMGISFALWSKVNEVRTENAKAQGDALVTLSNSVATYMTNNFQSLVNSTAITGVASIYAPTIPELITAGLLSNNFSVNNFYGTGYAVAISKVPAACVVPACDLSSLVNLTGGIIDYRTGLVDGPTLGQAIARMGGNGGFSDRATPATIKGSSGSWSIANPVIVAGVAVPGVIAIRGGYGSAGFAQFLRRDGTLPMTGQLNMGSQNISNANAINSNSIANASGITTQTLATTAAVTVGGALNVAGLTSTNGLSNSGNFTNTGSATVGGALAVGGLTSTNGIANTGNLTNSGNIVATGDVTGARFLPTTVVANGGTCTGFDGYVARTAAGSIASCISGVWATPNAASTPVPCSAQSVSWGGSCGASIGAVAAGTNTVINPPTTPSGATGNALFLCTAGAQVLQPGSSCTPPPCSTQTLSWGGGCSASFSTTSVGSSLSRSATTGTGSGTATCNSPGGSSGWSSPAGSCTPPLASCGATTVSWAGTAGGCFANISGTTSGNSIFPSNANSNRTGSATATCTNGSWSTSGTCDAAIVQEYPPFANYYYAGNLYLNAAYLGFTQNIGNLYCAHLGGGWTANLSQSSYRLLTANICNVGLDGNYGGYSCNAGVSGSYYTGYVFDQVACQAP